MAVNEHHRHSAHTHLKLGVITASDTRDAASDESGRLIRELLEGAGHRVAYYEVLPDSPEQIAEAVRQGLHDLDGVIINGGTGIAARDSTIEAIRPLIDKELEGFGELFRALSYNEIGSAAFLSRALAGISGGKIVVALPGSPNACRLAMEKLLLPELGHMAHLLGLAPRGHQH
ncbi:MAG: molybdenum cofactor biosynthesis protein B [Candidatus Binataceae bacterium]|jgi:molybdenum cofactor biosynthesis protein B